MKRAIYIFALIGLTSCVTSVKEDDSVETEPQSTILTKGECIDKVLYYKLETTSADYDSITTQYFHEVKDYTDTLALIIQDSIWKLESIRDSYFRSTVPAGSQMKADSLTKIIAELRGEIKFYNKSVVGYVFVHTFAVKKDTMSMIFLMDKNCLNSDAIPIKTVAEIDPEDFLTSVKDL